MPQSDRKESGYFDSTKRLLTYAAFMSCILFGLYWLTRSITHSPDTLGVAESGVFRVIDFLIFFAFGPLLVIMGVQGIRKLRSGTTPEQGE